ncbi:MAG: VCBS repeat-containing protein [Proteobacteria bacterium]|nr:VCBS repeat-containing protein [Pseudomonadota bacterium]
MSKTRLVSISFVMACMLCACGNDSQTQSTSDDSELCGGEQCKNNQKCVKNKCVSDDDDNDELCKKTQNTCEDDTTLKECVEGKKPVLRECENGICEDGECLESQNLDEVCEKTEEYCLSKKVFVTCVKGEKPKKQKCSELAEGSECLDGKCTAGEVQKVGVGDACSDDDVCPEGAYCDVNGTQTCTKYGVVGDPCSEEKSCGSNLTCFADVCYENVKIGDPCGEYSLCDSGECREGVCASISTEYGPCNEQLACPGGSVCIDKICVPTKGNCTSNKECKGDSYCCLDESCKEKKNICVPYSTENPYDPACVFKTKSGIFEAAVQCYWKPTYQPTSDSVTNTVVSGIIHNKQGIKTPLIVFISGNYTSAPFVVRILNPQTCEEVENISAGSSASRNLALADFDGDGFMEIVVPDGGPSIYKWDETKQKHTVLKSISIGGTSSYNILDIDNDGVPDLVGSNGSVARSDGKVLSTQSMCSNHTSPAVGDFNGDGIVDMANNLGVYKWNSGKHQWMEISTVSADIGDNIQGAYADFGTPGATADAFDFNHLDGKAEVVFTGSRGLVVAAVFNSTGTVLPQAQIVMINSFTKGGIFGYPPAIGDFDGDTFPEIGVASSSTFGVYDPGCKGPEAGKCQKKYVAWESETKDRSGMAGASAFDFDGDGRIEIVYGDECFSRVYDGRTGEVLFSSFRNSGTSLEYPTIADVDGDGSTEIVISSDKSSACNLKLDSSHRGVKCEDNEDCYSGSCIGGLCRCQDDSQCNWQTIDGAVFKQYSCMEALAGDESSGKVCRAVVGEKRPGIMILRDRLDRWVSSRTIWNQHSYNITNVDDDGRIPKTSDWKLNFQTEGLNNYRQQKQGATGTGVAPDITGRFTSAADACRGDASGISLKAQVCNRGTKAVGSKMPAVFYKGSIAPENILCVSYTEDMVPVKDCRDVSCSITKQQAEELTNVKIILVVNDDGKGGKTTVECNEGNNTDEITMAGCQIN